MTRYTWPAADRRQQSIAGGRLAGEIRRRIGLDGWNYDTAKDAALAELLATTPEMFNVGSFGAIGDGVVDDTAAIEAAFAAAVALGEGAAVVFPRGKYLVSRTLQPGGVMTLHFHGCEFKAATSGGTWTTVVDNLGADTGFVAFFDIAGFQDSAVYGRVKFDGNQVTNLVGIVKADIQNGANSGNTLWMARTNMAAFERAVYGQSDGSGFTGWYFANFQGFTNGYDLYLVGNSVDDMVFGVVRSQSSTRAADVSKANIVLDDCSGIEFHSVFVSGKDSTRDGIQILNGSSVHIHHLFVEDDFEDIIRISDNGYSVQIDNLMFGTSSLTATVNAAIIITAGGNGYLDVRVAGDAVNTDTITAIVRLSANNSNANRTTIVRQPFAIGSQLAPYLAHSPGSNPTESDVALAYTADGIAHYFFDGSTMFHYIEGLIVTATLGSGDNDDYDPGAAEQLRLSGDGGGSSDITGIIGGGQGRKITIVNVSANNIIISTSGTESAAANRIVSGGAEPTLAQNDVCILEYDNTSLRWRIVSLIVS